MTQTDPQHITLHQPQMLAQVVQQAAREQLPLVDYGVAHRGLGNPPPARHTRLTLDSPPDSHGIVEHYTRDFTVRAWAGATMGQLNTKLAESGQFIPIDADPDLTLGEVLLHNVSSALRPGYNAIRDISLGLRYIDGTGRDIHVGGRTVKNVAGYDITRLMVGSLGELGLVYEATVRTYAVPRQVLCVEGSLESAAQIDPFIPRLLASDGSPTRLHLACAGPDAPWRLHVGYHGDAAACDAMHAGLVGVAKAVPTSLRLDAPAARDLAQDAHALATGRAWQRAAPALMKLVVKPNTTGIVCDALRAAKTPGLRIDAMPTHGVIFVGGELNDANTLSLESLVAKHIGPGTGMRVWMNRPQSLIDTLPTVLPSQPDMPLLTRLKKTMDPSNLFNPGRLIQL